MAKSKTTRTRTSGKTSTSSSDNSWIEPAIDIGLTVATKALPKIWDSIFGSGGEPKEPERPSYDYDKSDDYWYNKCQELQDEYGKIIKQYKEGIKESKEIIDALNAKCEALDDVGVKQIEYAELLNENINLLGETTADYYEAGGLSLIWMGIKRIFGARPVLNQKTADRLEELEKNIQEKEKEILKLLENIK